MTAYLRRAFLGAIPEGLNWGFTQAFYHDPAMEPASKEYGIEGLKIGFIDPSLISQDSSIMARGSTQFGSPCILINPVTHNPINQQAREFFLRHEISHIKHADVDKMFILFGAVASGTSMALRYFGFLSGATGRIRRIWNSCCKEGFSVGLGATVLAGYSRHVEARADAEASSQISQEERNGAIAFFRSYQERNKILRNQEQLQLEALEREEAAKMQEIHQHYDPLIRTANNRKQDAHQELQKLQKAFDFMCNPNSFTHPEWCSWPVAQIQNPHYVTSKGGNGSLREVTREEFESLLQEDVDQAKQQYHDSEVTLDECNTEKDKDIERIQNTIGIKRNAIKRYGAFFTPLAHALISEEGDDRTDVLHPSASFRIRRLEENSRSIP